jgi:hypothetical protein
VLHAWVALTAHAPCPAHVPFAHWPHPSQVSVSVPQLPHDEDRVAFGAQAGALAHEQPPHVQLLEQVDVP